MVDKSILGIRLQATLLWNRLHKLVLSLFTDRTSFSIGVERKTNLINEVNLNWEYLALDFTPLNFQLL